jgi:hypothetical protein
MIEKDFEEVKPKPRAPKKPQRVEVIDKRGNIARPFEKDIDAWLGKGWQRVEASAGSAE